MVYCAFVRFKRIIVVVKGWMIAGQLFVDAAVKPETFYFKSSTSRNFFDSSLVLKGFCIKAEQP
jgi:hypothetical protein